MSGRPEDLVWEHGDNLAHGWRRNYCGMQKSGGGSTRFKQHLAARGSSVLHCSRVPPPVLYELFVFELVFELFVLELSTHLCTPNIIVFGVVFLCITINY
jgi:hypothetical protein